MEQVFESMDMRAKSKPCAGMKGLVQEGNEVIEEHKEEMILDAGLIGAARRVEHYEMAGYETARALAQQLGKKDAAQLLLETLREEMEADKQLAQIGKRLLKEGSAQSKAAKSEEAPAKRGGSKQAAGRGKSAKARGSRQSAGSGKAGHGNRVLTDASEIREWAEERGATPACVKGTGDRGDTGMLRLDFPGYTGGESLQEISWEDWSEKFDERGLALIVQDQTARGQKSNFNTLIRRDTAADKSTARSGR